MFRICAFSNKSDAHNAFSDSLYYKKMGSQLQERERELQRRAKNAALFVILRRPKSIYYQCFWGVFRVIACDFSRFVQFFWVVFFSSSPSSTYEARVLCCVTYVCMQYRLSIKKSKPSATYDTYEVSIFRIF